MALRQLGMCCDSPRCCINRSYDSAITLEALLDALRNSIKPRHDCWPADGELVC